MTKEFEIKSISAVTSNSFGYKWEVHVKVEMNVETWTKYKRTKDLGQLYGIDISNAVHAFNPNIPAYNPSVNDASRAKQGIKHVSLKYYLNDASKAEKLGLTVQRFSNGEVISKFNDYVEVKAEVPKEQFECDDTECEKCCALAGMEREFI